jgi:hypothetical protein
MKETRGTIEFREATNHPPGSERQRCSYWAGELGCHWSMIYYLRQGRRGPGRAMCELIRRRLAIEPSSWDRPAE